MQDTDQARSLLRLASVDYDALRATWDRALVANTIFGFHAQQAIEKTLKAWLAVRGIAYPRTHELDHLLILLADDGVDISAMRHLARFTVFAVQARYEEGIVTPADPLDRPAVVAEVGALLEHVTRQVAAQA